MQSGHQDDDPHQQRVDETHHPLRRRGPGTGWQKRGELFRHKGDDCHREQGHIAHRPEGAKAEDDREQDAGPRDRAAGDERQGDQGQDQRCQRQPHRLVEVGREPFLDERHHRVAGQGLEGIDQDAPGVGVDEGGQGGERQRGCQRQGGTEVCFFLAQEGAEEVNPFAENINADDAEAEEVPGMQVDPGERDERQGDEEAQAAGLLVAFEQEQEQGGQQQGQHLRADAP